MASAAPAAQMVAPALSRDPPAVPRKLQADHRGQQQQKAIEANVKKGKRVTRVNRRLRRYYLIVRLLPNVFALACLPLSLI